MQCAVNLQPLHKQRCSVTRCGQHYVHIERNCQKIERVQSGNDQNFFLLGNEIKGTQESVRKLKEVVDVRFKQMEFYLVNATLFLARTSLACDHVIVRHMHLLQAIRNYVYQMGTLYTHLKAYRAAFFAYKISLFSTISSLARGYMTPQFLLPQ